MALADILFPMPPEMRQFANMGQPGMPPGGPQPAAGGQGPTGSPPAAGGPQAAPGTPQAPPPAQAYVSQPDITQMNQQLAQPNMVSLMMKMQERQMAMEQWNRGVGMLAAAFSPMHDRPMIMASQEGMAPSAAGTMQGLLGMYQMQYELGQRQQLQQNLPKMLSDAGISQDYAPLIMANPSILGDVLKAHLGVTGDPAEKALQAARADWLQHNPGKTEADMLAAHPEFSDAISYAATKTATATTAATEAKTKTADILAAHSALPDLSVSTDDAIARIDRILGNQNLPNVLGAGSSITNAGYRLAGGDNASLLNEIDQLGAQTYAEGLSSNALKGSRKTQAEAKGVADALSQVNKTNQPLGSYTDQLRLLRDRLVRMKANATASAGIQPSGDLAGYEDRGFYDPNGALAGQTMPKTFISPPKMGGPAPAPGGGGGGGSTAPADFSKMNAADADAAYEKLDHGATFIDTDGKPKRKP